MRKSTSILLIAVVMIITSATFVSGQALRGRIDGTAKDAQGNAVPGVSITLTSNENGETVKTTSDSDGTFLFAEVKPGTYSITAEAAGFKRLLISDVTVQVATSSTVAIDLEVGGVTEEVTVNASEAQEVINTTTAEVGDVVDRQRILELPLDGRNPFELTALNAGVQTKSNSDGEIRNFSINGNRTVANNLTVDGVNASDNFLKTPANITLPVIPVSVESIAEFKVTTSLPSAEFGRGSAQINAVTASGTNKFRGSVFEYHRNTAFNANNFFNNSTILENGDNVEREPLIRNQFGGRLGGPIFKDKLFFFSSYEGKRETRGLSRNRIVYTDQALQGIFRYVKGLPTTPQTVAAATITAPAGTATTQSGTCRATAGGNPPRVVIPNGAICVQNVLGIGNTLKFGQPIDPTIRDILSVIPASE
ncbi:MAG: carboxypeptidase regulatory-like domain-containing protein [Pyrinomonadaceae bacterium]